MKFCTRPAQAFLSVRILLDGATVETTAQIFLTWSDALQALGATHTAPELINMLWAWLAGAALHY